MTDVSGRMRRIDAGRMQSPACCAVCGSTSNEDGYLDPQIFIEYHGNIYFCCHCASEMGAFFKMVTYEEHEHIMLEMENLRELLLEANSKAAKAEGVLDEIRSLNSFFGNTADPAVVALISNGGSSKNVEDESVNVRNPARSVKD